jgi:3-oxoadipate enol-lactonase
MVSFDRSSALERIGVATLVIAGEHDRDAPPAVMKKMAAAIPRGTYIEMPGIGHLPNLEAPDEFDSFVLNFLQLPAELLH